VGQTQRSIHGFSGQESKSGVLLRGREVYRESLQSGGVAQGALRIKSLLGKIICFFYKIKLYPFRVS